MSLAGRRAAEEDKYRLAFNQSPEYGQMSKTRQHLAQMDLQMMAGKGGLGSLLDVGAGRGLLIAMAIKMKFHPVRGLDVVPQLPGVVRGPIYAIPFDDDSWDWVTCCDVVEHLVPEDTEIALQELKRVARRGVMLTASNLPSMCPVSGVDLHVNKRPYDEWDELVEKNIGPFERAMGKRNSARYRVYL